MSVNIKQNGQLVQVAGLYNTAPYFAPVIYSTDEREIGVWTDGKPLYQCTWILTFPSTTGNITFTEAAIPNLDKIISSWWSVKGIGERTYVSWYQSASILFDEHNSTGLSVYIPSSYYSGEKLYYTAQYTKATDTPGSGTWTPQGVPAVHYSTNEQVVGTWIDGSTLYERVIEYTTPFTIPNGSWYTSTESYTGISKIVNAWIINASGAIYNGTIVVIENDKLVIGNQTKDQPINNLKYVTIQYTKQTS